MENREHRMSYKQIPRQAFAALGVAELAYIKHVVADGEDVYAIFAADGTKMGEVPDREIAFAAVVQHDLSPVSVH
jgi:hypothetical protein